MSLTERPTLERLLDGARKIGAIWRLGDRCATTGWAVKSIDTADPDGVEFGLEDLCRCKEKATRFCKAKVQWIMLALTEREIVTGDYGFVLTMSGKEWDATGLTLGWQLEGVGKLKVGIKTGLTMKDLIILGHDPVSAIVPLKLMHAFKDSKLEFEKPKEEAKENPVEGPEKFIGIE